MHRAIAAWLTTHPWRAACAGAICGALSPQMMLPFMILAGAIPVLAALRFDARTALGIAATGAAAAAWVVFSASQPLWWILAGILVLFFSPALLALLLKRTGSMNLCFQVAVLGSAGLLIMVYLALADPVAVWTELLLQVLDSMAAAGLRIEGDRTALVQVWARTMWGALAALTLAMTLGGLFLGRWWQSLLQAPGEFGREYRQLRLGLTLGAIITGVFILALTTESPLAASLAWIAFVSLAFQGLAAAHRSKAGGRLNRGWLAAIYVLLIVPLSMSITVFVLAIWGYADNWLRPRPGTSH
ncbi:hypothetical protein [Steroidobacter denitrificans]|uniref:hypothetical protein n=1 Tax=Steroidobacter denitrificans TaxID=465721 RepID=UPI0008339B69|nr:hypothetical protein [Steroidobacter denitrificans]